MCRAGGPHAGPELRNTAVEEGLVSQVQWRSKDDFLKPISDQ